MNNIRPFSTFDIPYSTFHIRHFSQTLSPESEKTLHSCTLSPSTSYISLVKPSNHIQISASDCELTAIGSSGPGGQHVNKVATAIQLRFDIMASSLPDWVKTKLVNYKDNRINKEGIVLIKASQHRSQLRNREEAVKRLNQLIQLATKPRKVRKATKPSKSAIKARLKAKARRSAIKKLRGKVDLDE